MVSMSSTRPMRLAVERDGYALFERDDDLGRLARRILGVPGERVRLLGRGRPRVLEDAALDGAAPHVLVDRVQLLLRRRDRDLPLVGELDAVGAGQAPHAHRRHHVEVGREDARRHLEAHLVVALAGATVTDRVGPVPARRRDEVLDDDRPRQRRHQRVLAFVERVRLKRGHEEVARRTLRARR